MQRAPLSAEDYRVEDHGYKTPCWIWAGRPMSKGYGKVTIAGKKYYAHRAMYEQEVGPISAGLHLDHLCRVTLCVNPLHLEPVTHAVNLKRGKGTKITDEEVVAIRADPRMNIVIAAEYGLHSSYVGRIKNLTARIAM